MTARVYGNPEFHIGDRPVGPGHPCYVIAEAGSNHNRDLATARQLIEVAAEAGADAVKFQTYTAEGLYSRRTPEIEYLKENGLLADQESVWELIKRVEMPWEWHAELARHSAECGITFFSTPFEDAAVDALEAVGVPAYKIASYEVNHLPLIARVARTGKPVLISTGMASLGDIERALDTAAAAGARDLLVMHCAVNYPPRFEDLNLRAITTLRDAFQIPIGWSDHTPGHTADVVAVTLGACAVEKHFTLSRDQTGPDHPFALEPNELDKVSGTAGDALDRIFRLLDALSLIAVLVAGLGMVNTFSMSVMERVREIGVLRATGMTSRQVWGMVVIEAGVLGLVGALVGAGVGLVVGALLVAWSSAGFGPVFDPPWGSIGLAVLFGFLVSIAASIYPAGVASRISIVRALQHE